MFAKLWRTRSRLCRSLFLRVNIPFAAFFKLYKICALLIIFILFSSAPSLLMAQPLSLISQIFCGAVPPCGSLVASFSAAVSGLE